MKITTLFVKNATFFLAFINVVSTEELWFCTFCTKLKLSCLQNK